VLDALRLGCHQLLGMRVRAHAAISTSVDLARAEAGPVPPASPTRCCAGCRPTTSMSWLTRRTADRARPGLSHPQWVVDAARRGVGDDQLDALLTADNEPPARHPRRAPGSQPRRGACRSSRRRSRRTASCRRREPPDVRRWPTAGPACRTRGRSCRPRRWPRLRSTGPTSGGSTCAPAGRKAACSPPLRRRTRGRLVANERQPHRADLVRARARRRRASRPCRRGRDDAPLAGRVVRPGPRRRARAPASGAATPARGALATASRADLRDLVPLQRGTARPALDLARLAGVVLYATCSPVLAETWTCSDRCWSVATTDAGRPTRCSPGPRLLPTSRTAGAARRHRAALAAPPRHRRDVPGPAPALLTVTRASRAAGA
jgi:16S rRNA (cytosine967-C5)-methyltransferase